MTTQTTTPAPGTQVRIRSGVQRFGGHIATVIDAPDMWQPGIVVRFEPSTYIDFWIEPAYWFSHDEYEVLARATLTTGDPDGSTS